MSVETRTIPNKDPQPSRARTSLDVHSLSVDLRSVMSPCSASANKPLISCGWSTSASKNSCLAIHCPNHGARFTWRQPRPAFIVACSNSPILPVNFRCMDLSNHNNQTRPAGGASSIHGNCTCRSYPFRRSSNVFKLRHPQCCRHLLPDRNFDHVASRSHSGHPSRLG